MDSKTPQFDSLLNAYYVDAQPGQRICHESGEVFDVSAAELALYKSLRVPIPTVSPRIRYRRQRAFIGGLDLFRRELLDGTSFISMYDPASPAPVMPNHIWYSDAFDATSYGREIDPTRSFFEQWKDFSFSVPRPSIIHDITSQNSDWCLYDISSKDCYLTFGGVDNENILYSDFCVQTKFCVDCTSMVKSEWCYDSVQCFQCSQAFFSERCDSCFNIYFCFGCQNSSDCFGCTNLHNKKFCFFNEQLTEAEYRDRLSKIDLSDSLVIDELKNKARDLWEKSFHHAGANYISENVEGDDLVSCVNVKGVSIFESQRVYNGFDLASVKDSADITTCSNLERSYNSLSIVEGYENLMNSTCETCIDVEYSELCVASEHCFGCIGLRHKKFYIFNREYPEEEYWKLLDQIKTEMLKRGEYGNFFSYQTSLFAYNTSHADAFFPLSKDAAEQLGARWHEFEQGDAQLSETPNTLAKIIPDILKTTFRCASSGRIFRIIKPELEFHQKFGIALPKLHSTLRRKQRQAQALPVYLSKKTCVHCGKEIFTRIPTLVFVPVLCDNCYAVVVYSEPK